MILIDTTPLVALCDPRDDLNGAALRDLDRLARKRLVLCLPVLTEACFLLPHAVQRQRLRRILEEFWVKPYRANDDTQMWFEVLEWLARYEEHEPDWADGYLAVVSGKERSWKLWTYDGEFHTTWRRPDGTRIPLAVREARPAPRPRS